LLRNMSRQALRLVLGAGNMNEQLSGTGK